MVRSKLCVRTVPTKMTPRTGSWSFQVGRLLLIKQRKRNFRCSLIYKEVPVLRWPGATARYSCLRVPVETGTPPRRDKVRSVRDTRQRRLSLPPLPCLSSPNRTRLRWAPVWLAASPPLGRKTFWFGKIKKLGPYRRTFARRYGRRLLGKDQTFSGSGYSTPKVSTVTFFMRWG